MVHADSEHPPRPPCGERSRFVSRSKPEGARVRRRVDVCKRGGLHARILSPARALRDQLPADRANCVRYRRRSNSSW
ncbi:hypothetical protein BRN52_15125 [Xanthomonas oryzae pv. oryzae]|nr:hypothetical protein BRN52_15125 [Xanthomonas oryzae pv. oryzae]AXM40409.1 hypothetical protein BRN51_14400 [Xanthomonas oryzae pv. oryzae]QBA11017.1 hypothetical protein DZA53_11275 [Xanthomonas oryzae pv. oryzae]QEJ67668.1 hypothetical protein BXO1_003195 [Xanthomonas oryzae pv. oryzae]RBA74240.1 hypothetical protein BRO09_11475 [Xanthomonas oryzae pv. oryzae]